MLLNIKYLYRLIKIGVLGFWGFAVDWMRKDLGIAMDEAKNNGSDLPITKIIDGYYSEVQKNSGNRFDTSSLITRLKKNK